MDTNYIVDSGLTYCGQEAQEIFSKDVFSLDLRALGVTYIDRVRGRRKIYMGNFDESVWQQYNCSFEPDGSVSLSEAYIEVVPIKVNKEICRSEFLDNFMVEQMEMSLQGKLPQSFSNWYFGKLREKMKKDYEEIAWKGDTDYTGTTKAYLSITDGWEKIITDSASTATEVTGASQFTVDNILSQVEAVIKAGLDAAAQNETSTENYKVMMNKADVDLLKMKLGTICCPNNESIFSNYAKGPDGGIYIYGFPIVPTSQSRNFILFGPARNLVLAFDSFSSHLEYKIIDMKEHTLEDKYRIGAISNIGLGVIYPELFTYTKA